jgi:hypothetical protein
VPISILENITSYTRYNILGIKNSDRIKHRKYLLETNIDNIQDALIRVAKNMEEYNSICHIGGAEINYKFI